MTDSLQRFHDAQASSYLEALAEIRDGRKRSHWIWYIFPQLAGLGHSAMAQAYAIKDMSEARAYLLDAVLFERFREITQAVAEQLEQGVRLPRLMGAEVDALKMISSVTLFRRAALGLAGENYQALAGLCDRVLDDAAAQGYPACRYTVGQVTTE